MVGIDLRNRLMGIVTSNQNCFSNGSSSSSSESSFNSIFDKAQLNQQNKEIHNKETVKPKESYEDSYDKDIQDTIDESATDNKISDSDKVQDDKPAKEFNEDEKVEESINVNEETNTDSEEKIRDKNNGDKEIENEILVLLSQMTGLEEEQISRWLIESGYEASDLLNTKIFGEVINQMYLELKDQDVLLLENGIDEINEIYKQIKELENRITSISENTAKSNAENLETSTMLDNVQITNSKNINSEEMVQNQNVVANLQNIEGNKYLSGKAVATEEVKPINSISGQVIEGGSTDTQTVMPITHFRTAGRVNLWSNEVINTTRPTMMTGDFEIDIIKQIDLKQIGMSKELNIKLNPKELGEMSIKLVEENSNIVAQISVDNEKTKDLLLSQIEILKKSLGENGINIEDVTVDIKQNSQESQMQQEKQKSSKRIEELINKHLTGEDIDDEITEQIKISEVDYTA